MRPAITLVLVLIVIISLGAMVGDASSRAVRRLSRSRAQRATAFLQQNQNLKVQQDIRLLQTVAISSEAKATAQEQAILNDPVVQKAVNAKTPDAVDRLIQDILVGRGHGGVVTSEFNEGGVHATIISNVNQLRVTTMDNSKEENQKSVSEQKQKQSLNQQLEDTERENNKHDKEQAQALAGPESSEEASEESSQRADSSRNF